MRGMIARLARAPVKPWPASWASPQMGVVIRHKGKRSFRVTVHGKTCHSSLAPHGVNAIEYAARLIVKIREIGERLARSDARDPLYDVPYTTTHTGVVRGNTALNIVPDACTFEFEFRPLATDDVEQLADEVMRMRASGLEPQMRAVDPLRASRSRRCPSFPGWKRPLQVTSPAWRNGSRNDGAARWPTGPKPACLRSPASQPW